MKGNMTATWWTDRTYTYMLTNAHYTSAGNFHDEQGKATKSLIATDYNHHTGYVDVADQMSTSYSISHHTWKRTKKLFFHLSDLTILSSCFFLSSCGAKSEYHGH
jgi:hypothetical protein